MDSAVYSAFVDEMAKLSYGLRQATKVLKTVKGRQIKAPDDLGIGYSGTPGATKSRKGLISGMLSTGASKGDAAAYADEALEGAGGLVGGKPRVYTPARGDAVSFFRQHGGGTRDALKKVKKPEQHRMLEGVVKGHELAESKVPGRLGVEMFGHRSPDVILQEHNMIQTLPKNMKAVGDVLRAARRGGEARQLKETMGIEYGKGERFSRHARKRLMELADKAGGRA